MVARREAHLRGVPRRVGPFTYQVGEEAMTDILCAMLCVTAGACLGYLAGRLEDLRHERKCKCGRKP